MNFMYSPQTQLSQLQPQQKSQIITSQAAGGGGTGGKDIRSALSQQLTMLTGPNDKQATALVQGVSQGQILNLGGATTNTGSPFNGQILNLPNGGAGPGQNFYVMIPQTQTLESAAVGTVGGGAGGAVTQHQKIAPMGVLQATADNLSAAATGRSDREEKRRQTHNEVERRRRGKINMWIQKLAEMVPNCKDEMGTKQQHRPGSGAPGGSQNPAMKSNCGVLMKTVNFIQELQIAHNQVVERLQEQNQVLVEMAKVREALKRSEQENLLLRNQLKNHGIEPMEYKQNGM